MAEPYCLEPGCGLPNADLAGCHLCGEQPQDLGRHLAEHRIDPGGWPVDDQTLRGLPGGQA